MLLTFLAPAFPDLLEKLLESFDVPAVAVPKALLHHPAKSEPDVAVVHEVVLDLRQDGIRVQIETGLGAIPPRIPVDRHVPDLTCPVGRPGPGRVLVEPLGEMQPVEN